jgi:hypothetical protein
MMPGPPTILFHGLPVRRSLGVAPYDDPSVAACVSLPAVSPQSSTPVRHITFEKHLSNLLVHVLKTIADDDAITGYDRDIAFQLEQQLRKAVSSLSRV